MAKEIELTGNVPISVTVDLETRSVTEVRMLDEEAVTDLPRFENDHEWS